MTAEITYSPTTLEDGEALASLRVAAMRESLERVGRFDPQRARDRFLGSFSPEVTTAIHYQGERVGFYALRRDEVGLYLDHLYIHPSMQGRGLGAAVLARVFARADQEGLDIRLGALKQSDSNRFYERHGFEFTHEGEFDNYYVRRVAGVIRPGPAPEAADATR